MAMSLMLTLPMPMSRCLSVLLCRLGFSAADSTDTSFEFLINFVGTPASTLPTNALNINCSVSDVDQIQLFVNALSIPAISDVFVNGSQVDWIPEADQYR
jgi:hypothetical protein